MLVANFKVLVLQSSFVAECHNHLFLANRTEHNFVASNFPSLDIVDNLASVADTLMMAWEYDDRRRILAAQCTSGFAVFPVEIGTQTLVLHNHVYIVMFFRGIIEIRVIKLVIFADRNVSVWDEKFAGNKAKRDNSATILEQPRSITRWVIGIGAVEA